MKNMILLFFIVIALGSFGCSRQTIRDVERFDPNVFVGDYLNRQIVDRNNKTISCDDPEFNNFGAMHVDKWKELNRILSRYRRRPPLKIQKELKELLRTFNQR
jgi:uncharacterized protein YcbK (DUF882 family)